MERVPRNSTLREGEKETFSRVGVIELEVLFVGGFGASRNPRER